MGRKTVRPVRHIGEHIDRKERKRKIIKIPFENEIFPLTINVTRFDKTHHRTPWQKHFSHSKLWQHQDSNLKKRIYGASVRWWVLSDRVTSAILKDSVMLAVFWVKTRSKSDSEMELRYLKTTSCQVYYLSVAKIS